jgi:DNA-binding XRE family transcriptional regulator
MISRISQQALKTLGNLIKTVRQKQNASQVALAERLAVTRQTVMAIEKGDAKVAIGTVFECAHVLGIPLFSDNPQQLLQWQATLNTFSGILPKKIRPKKPRVSDEF